MTPIVLVPGLLCSAEIFAAQATALWPYGPVTIASTLEGSTMAEMAAAILAGAPPRFALAGISMGGYICLEIIRQAPERVVKLALLDTSARPDTPEQTAVRRERLARAKAGEFEAVVVEATGATLHPDRQDDPELRAVNLRMALAVGLEGMVRQQEAIIARIDSRPSLGAITVPTLVLVGDSDPLTPPERAREIAEGIAGAELVEVPDCGHASTIEQPEAVNAALIRWITA
jgi:pimeloyl-ACP methyl ester carboxylesterase